MLEQGGTPVTKEQRDLSSYLTSNTNSLGDLSPLDFGFSLTTLNSDAHHSFFLISDGLLSRYWHETEISVPLNKWDHHWF